MAAIFGGRRPEQGARDRAPGYLVVIAVLALLTSAGFLQNRIALDREHQSASKISLSAALLTLSQKLASGAERYALAGTPDEAARAREELGTLRDVFESSHLSARAGSGASGLVAYTSPEILTIYDAPPHNLGTKVSDLLALVDALLDMPHHEIDPVIISDIRRRVSDELAPSFERVAAQLELDALQTLRTIRRLETAIFAAHIVVLLGAAFLVFRPLALKARTQARDLYNARAELDHREHHDRLTGLPNRESLKVHIARLIAQREREGFEFAVLHLDLEKFRQVNDSHGLSAGDRVLKLAAERLRGSVREADFVSRVGGDDFVAVITPITNATDVAPICRRILDALTQPFDLAGRCAYVGVSIGVTMSSDTARFTAEDILMNAEIALNGLREGEGSNQVRYFSPAMRADIQRRETVAREIDDAIESGQIVPFFQPQFDVETGQVTGFEALVRWIHPERGVLSPFHFLDIAEATGKTERIGEVVLDGVLRAINGWDRDGLLVESVGVNFSSVELQNPRLVEKIKWAVDRYEVDPNRIAIEILETVLIDSDDDLVVRNIRGLADMGFAIDMDDFGTGHASISNIRRFAVDRIKIDRAFVSGIDTDQEQMKLTNAMVRMAEALGIEALAEGVETEAEHRTLASLGCRFLQGYGIGRPMPYSEATEWLRQHDAAYYLGKAVAACEHPPEFVGPPRKQGISPLN